MFCSGVPLLPSVFILEKFWRYDMDVTYRPDDYRSDPQMLQDLAWVIQSPALLDPQMDERFANFSQYLDAERGLLYSKTRADVLSELEQFLSNQINTRVGIYFENLIRFWIEALSSMTLLAYNHQVHQKGKTLGAFDYIVRHVDGSVAHWEVAVKYYLALNLTEDWVDWVGLNPNDSLDKKINHMLQHQLPLSASEQGRSQLATLGLDRPPIQKAMVKGYLFRPLYSDDRVFAKSARGACYGRWLYYSQLPVLAKMYPDGLWAERHRPDWLSPAVKRRQSCHTTKQWLAQLDPRDGLPRMMSRMAPYTIDASDSDALCFELERLIVVPDGWYQDRHCAV